MGRVGRGKEVLSTGVTEKVKAYLEGRSSRLDQSMSWVIAGAVDFWIACGAPPLSAADRHTPLSPELRLQLAALLAEPERAALLAAEDDEGATARLKQLLRKAELKASAPDPERPQKRTRAVRP